MAGWVAAVASALLTAGAEAPAEAVGSFKDPVKLFNQVCMGDETPLPPKLFSKRVYADLPAGAKEVLGFALPSMPPAVKSSFALAPAEVPNSLLRLEPKGRLYLMIPAAEQEAGRAAPHCAVLWRGNHYPTALKALRTLAPLSSLSPPPKLGEAIPGVNYTGITAGGLIAGAAEYQNWTILRVAPDLSPNGEQTSQ